MTTQLSIKIFADGADLDSIAALAADPRISGFTTNPTLMRQAGVEDYELFAQKAIAIVAPRPISLEVFSDDIHEMERQARTLASWGENVNVKIPVTNTKGESTVELVRRLSHDGIKVNVTAVFTLEQVAPLLAALEGGAEAFISIFAGRIADAGVDPIPTVTTAVARARDLPNVRFIWASPREVLNVVQADAAGCQVITVTPDLLKKLGGLGKDLHQFSLETVEMFRGDAVAAGYQL